MIITEETKLRLMCEEVKTVEEGEEIGTQLLTELTKSENGIYLCEDLHTSYWPDYGGGYKRRNSFIAFVIPIRSST